MRQMWRRQARLGWVGPQMGWRAREHPRWDLLGLRLTGLGSWPSSGRGWHGGEGGGADAAWERGAEYGTLAGKAWADALFGGLVPGEGPGLCSQGVPSLHTLRDAFLRCTLGRMHQHTSKTASRLSSPSLHSALFLHLMYLMYLLTFIVYCLSPHWNASSTRAECLACFAHWYMPSTRGCLINTF